MSTYPSFYLSTSEQFIWHYKVRALLNAGYDEHAAFMAANWATEVIAIAFNPTHAPVIFRTRLGGMRLDARKVEIQ